MTQSHNEKNKTNLSFVHKNYQADYIKTKLENKEPMDANYLKSFLESESLIEQQENYNNDKKTNENIEGVGMNSNIENKLDILIQSISNLTEQDKKINEKIDTLKKDQHQVEIKLVEQSTKTTMLMWFIPLLVSFIVTAGTLFMNSSINSIKDEIKLQISSLKEINSLQIQKDVSQEFLKQKK